MNYTFAGKTKMLTIALMGIGLAAIIYGFVMTPERIWANLLLNGFYYLAIALSATFFIAVNYVSEAGWHAGFKRIPEAMSAYLPYGAIVILALVITGMLGVHDIWHWMDSHFQQTDSVYLNSGKKVYLTNTFFLVRTIAYLLGWIFLAIQFRRISLKEDDLKGTAMQKKGVMFGAMFLVFFAVTSSMSAWDWLMSIDVHWYSTLFGWYIFSGLFVSGLIMIMLILLYLKGKDLMDWVNENHIHDLAKLVFAFSIFWMYLWFSQYMLIWYSNIPEEINYFLERYNTNYRTLVITMLVINFLFPLLILMHRDAKRSPKLLFIVGIILLVGHYLDLFQIIMPGVVKDKWNIGFTEIGMTLGFLGLFLFVTLTALSKRKLMAGNQPFFNESLQHHI